MGHQTLATLLLSGLLIATGCDTSVELDPHINEPDEIIDEERDVESADEDQAAVEAEPASTERPAERVAADKPVNQSPGSGYLGGVAAGYRSAREQIEILPVTQAIQHFHATEGRYPKSHEEFMSKVWKPLQTPLPEVEEGYELRYNPEDHQLYKVPVEDAEEQQQ